jgi:hypothetical protein
VSLLSAVSTWWFGHIGAPAVQANIVDPINAFAAQAALGFVDESLTGTSVVLSTTAAKAAGANVTFVVPTGLTGRYKITTSAQFVPASAANGRYLLQSSYNTGGSVVIGSAVSVGQAIALTTDNTAAGGGPAGNTAVGTVLLTAGTYTAYPVVTRNAGGNSSDTANTPYVLVEHIGVV